MTEDKLFTGKGSFVYGSLTISQHPNIQTILTKLLQNVEPMQILEIGTMHGGLTLLIRNILDSLGLTNTLLKTYDIHEQKFLKPLNIPNIDIITKNMFSHDYRNFASETTKQELQDYINRHGTTIVMCDGGSKANEFRLISDLLKQGDIIMAHDYAPNKEFHEITMRDKVWNWMEICDHHIESSIVKNNLVKFMYDDLLSVAWLCMRKQ